MRGGSDDKTKSYIYEYHIISEMGTLYMQLTCTHMYMYMYMYMYIVHAL